MKVLGIIPARYASSRFPGKPLVDIKGKSMIRRVYEQASQSELIDEVVVATDDERIFQHIQEFGGKVLMTSADHKNGTERCGEVVKDYPEMDVVINIQGDEPLIKPEQLNKVIGLFQDPEIKIGSLFKKMDDPNEIRNPNRVKVVLDKNNYGLYFSRCPIPYTDNLNSADSDYYKHIGIYAWRSDVLKEIVHLPQSKLEKTERLEQLRWLFNGYEIKMAETTIETPNIDTPEDLDKVLDLL